MKTDANFNLSKMAKLRMGSIYDKKERSLYKKYAIIAEATAAKQERVILKGGNDKE